MWATNNLPKGIHADKFAPLFNIIHDLLRQEREAAHDKGFDDGTMAGIGIENMRVKQILEEMKKDAPRVSTCCESPMTYGETTQIMICLYCRRTCKEKRSEEYNSALTDALTQITKENE